MIVIGTVAAYRFAKTPGPDDTSLEAFATVQGAMVVDILDAASQARVVRTSDVLPPDPAGIIDCTRVKVESRTYPVALSGGVRTCDVAIYRCAVIIEAFALTGPSYTTTRRLACR